MSSPRVPRVEFLWFEDCPSHVRARELLRAVLESRGLKGVAVEEVDATDSTVAQEHRFPGSPTIRVEGVDIEPGFEDPGDYTPRCRIYWTKQGTSGIPDREWIEEAVDSARRH